jgi:choline dehydrogenase-like flavoprotein
MGNAGRRFLSNERLSSQPRLGRRFKDKLKNSRLVSVCLNHAVSGLELDADGSSVRAVQSASKPSAENRPTADIYVLACGGLQATGILLDMQRNWPRHFGGDAGPLGRFYMGHLAGSIANIVLHDPADIQYFDYQRNAMGYWTRRRFTFSPETQTKQGLLNTALWLGTPPLYDPSHGSATASTLHLALKMLLGMKSHALAFHRGDQPMQLREHLSNVLGDTPDAIKNISRAVGQYLTRDDLRPLLIRNDAGKYALRYHSEQIPNPSNRIRLIRDHGPGIGVSVDFRFSEDDARSVVRAHEVLDDALRQSDRGHVEYRQTPDQRLSSVMDQALDGYHQIGTTRMGESDRVGVVDRNCRAYGVENLYVAGSSVFSTSGQANPTFLAVTMAVRLADHLRGRLAVRPELVLSRPDQAEKRRPWRESPPRS